LALALYVFPAKVTLLTVNVTLGMLLLSLLFVTEHCPEALVTQETEPLMPSLQAPLAVAPDTGPSLAL
jgi:hypothetical protein